MKIRNLRTKKFYNILPWLEILIVLLWICHFDTFNLLKVYFDFDHLLNLMESRRLDSGRDFAYGLPRFNNMDKVLMLLNWQQMQAADKEPS